MHCKERVNYEVMLGQGPRRCGWLWDRLPGTIHLHGAAGAGTGTLLIFGSDDGLQILTLPPLFAPVTIGSIVGGTGDLFGFVDGGLFYVIPVHVMRSIGGNE